MVQMASAMDKTNSTNFAENILSFNSQKTLKEFFLDELKSEDTIVISTKNSQYSFKVLEPSLRLGILSGGSLGKKSCKAFLLSKENNKIVFLLEEKHNKVAHLFTSPIKTLSISRNFS